MPFGNRMKQLFFPGARNHCRLNLTSCLPGLSPTLQGSAWTGIILSESTAYLILLTGPPPVASHLFKVIRRLSYYSSLLICNPWSFSLHSKVYRHLYHVALKMMQTPPQKNLKAYYLSIPLWWWLCLFVCLVFLLWAQYITMQLLTPSKGENSMLAILRESGGPKS